MIESNAQSPGNDTKKSRFVNIYRIYLRYTFTFQFINNNALKIPHQLLLQKKN